MAAEVIGATTAQVDSGTSIGGTEPSGAQQGDLLVAQYRCHNAQTGPSGWTKLGEIATSGEHHGIYYIVRGSSAPSLTFTQASTSTQTLIVAAIRGQHPDTPIDVSQSAAQSGGGSSVQAPSATTTVDDCLVLRCWGGRPPDTVTVRLDPPSGVTTVEQVAVGGSARHAATIGAHVQEAAGATGTSDAAAVGNTVSFRNAWTVAIAPGDVAVDADLDQHLPALTQQATAVQLVPVDADLDQGLPALTQQMEARVGRAPVPQPGPTLLGLTRQGPQVVPRADVLIDGVKQDEATVVDGGVTYDASRRVWRTCDLTLHGPIPAGPTDLYSPTVTTVRLFRGAIPPDGTTADALYEPVGHYAFSETDVERAGRTIRLSGYSFEQLVSDARWEDPYVIAAGTPLDEAIADALATRLPPSLAQPLAAQTSPYTTPAVVFGEERDNDPWDDLAGLAAAAGMLLWFDREGRPTLTSVPDPDTAPVVADYTVGESPLLLTLTRRLTGRPYNVVQARGETPDSAAPVQATVVDDNPASASFVGRYRKPYFLTSSMITTDSQALDAATGQLRRLLGLGEIVSMLTVPLPSLDVWQVIRARDADLHVDARYVIDSMRLPLRPGQGSITTRRRRI